jgi:hypothetical protein
MCFALWCHKITTLLNKEVQDWEATMISDYEVPKNSEKFQAEKDNFFYIFILCVLKKRCLWINPYPANVENGVSS